MPERSYYGDRISDNMIVTPEGYLICKNVPIGRTGWMDYLGSELPAAFGEPPDKICQVYRSPEELFSEATIASFEFKPVTNNHPVMNLDLQTVEMSERGQVSNVHSEGNFLKGDLCVKDALLIQEIQGGKRQTSSGYDCEWVKIGDGKYEQRGIIGNHVAVVDAGRAGPKVAIHDQAPNHQEQNQESKNLNQDKGGQPGMSLLKKILGIGLKAYVADASPEELTEAVDEIAEANKKEDKEEKKETEDKAGKDKSTKDEDGSGKGEETEALNDEITALKKEVAELTKSIQKLVKSDKKVHREIGAEETMDALEKELEKSASNEETGKENEAKDNKAKDTKPEEEETKEDEVEETKEEQVKEDEASTEKHKFVKDAVAINDATLRQVVKDMKPIIMSIPDEQIRTKVASDFAKTVQDARKVGDGSKYGKILETVTKNKTAAMDKAAENRKTIEERSQDAANAWNKQGAKMRGEG
jgi:hypothetical protein